MRGFPELGLAIVGVAAVALLAHATVGAAPAAAPLVLPSTPALARLRLSPPREVAVRQDPFISPVDDEARAPSAPTPPPGIDAQPRPAGAGASPDAPAAAASPPAFAVRAVVVGDRSYALVEEGGRQRILSIGDRIAGSAVRAITMQGVVLADGSRHAASEGNPVR